MLLQLTVYPIPQTEGEEKKDKFGQIGDRKTEINTTSQRDFGEKKDGSPRQFSKHEIHKGGMKIDTPYARRAKPAYERYEPKQKEDHPSKGEHKDVLFENEQGVASKGISLKEALTKALQENKSDRESGTQNPVVVSEKRDVALSVPVQLVKEVSEEVLKPFVEDKERYE